jgi:hypothetical protein
LWWDQIARRPGFVVGPGYPQGDTPTIYAIAHCVRVAVYSRGIPLRVPWPRYLAPHAIWPRYLAPHAIWPRYLAPPAIWPRYLAPHAIWPRYLAPISGPPRYLVPHAIWSPTLSGPPRYLAMHNTRFCVLNHSLFFDG